MPRLTFLGAAKTVTGSQYLVEAGDEALMIDCGLFQGEQALRRRNWAEPSFEPARVGALVLTHTHLDHIGRVPRLVRQGFRGPIYCTPATLELAEVLLRDAAHLQMEDAEYFNRKRLSKHEPALPLFDEADVEACLPQFEAVPLAQPRRVGSAFEFSFRDAGHLLGAASVDLRVREGDRETRVLFSGDVGRYDAVLTKDPEPAIDADYVLAESTYGNRLHTDVPPEEQLTRVLQQTFDRGGVLLVPAFAVGRAQQMIHLMERIVAERRLPPFPIHLDSPMAVDATRIYARYPGAHRQDGVGVRSLLHDRFVHLHRSREESQRLNELRGPAVILSSSGMLAGGRILHHCRVRLPDHRNTLLITGYQATGTLGRALLDKRTVVRIHKSEVPVRAHIEQMKGMSGHADWREMLRWLAAVKRARRVFLTHGEEEAADALAMQVGKQLGLATHVPAWDEVVELQ